VRRSSNALPPVATLSHVVRHARNDHSCQSRHPWRIEAPTQFATISIVSPDFPISPISGVHRAEVPTIIPRLAGAVGWAVGTVPARAENDGHCQQGTKLVLLEGVESWKEGIDVD